MSPYVRDSDSGSSRRGSTIERRTKGAESFF